LSLLWTTSYKAKNWRTVTFKLAAILDLKVKTRSNCKTDIKKWIPWSQKPQKPYITQQFQPNYWKAIFQDGLRWPFWIFANYDLCPHFWERHPLQFHSLTFKEDKNTKKRTFALQGHGSAPDDSTITKTSDMAGTVLSQKPRCVRLVYSTWCLCRHMCGFLDNNFWTKS